LTGIYEIVGTEVPIMKLNGWITRYVLLLFCATTAIAASAQGFKTLVSFNGTKGKNPVDSLVQGLDGKLYGTTSGGGASSACLGGCGTVFKITASGTLSTLYSFCTQGGCSDGALPSAGLVLGIDGNLYGTTVNGGFAIAACGGSGCGTIFKISPNGTLTTLYRFCAQPNCTDGLLPYAGLVLGTDGNFYGTTYAGGAHGEGTVFRITRGGTRTTLHSFNGTDGAHTYAGLVEATDGNFYGTTFLGGTNGWGTVFKITPGGTLTTLHSFDRADGAEPWAALVQATDGNFYGTTSLYGTGFGCGQGFLRHGCGTVFKITSRGTLTTLLTFDLVSGAYPHAVLVQATDGNFYATTTKGGASSACSGGCGTIFKITPGLRTLHSFDSADGTNPSAGLVQATDGNFYGTTSAGGAENDGTAFSLSVGLGPFVETLPTSGKVGTPAIILGNNLTGATSVTFNGAVATFTVVSSTEIKTTVPSGTTTGKVKVTTPIGTLTSNVPFRVP
jgi:uncharacterized repeat protein (TIGR03803 family)